MNFFDVFIISFVEGITELLPISSTGHMIIVSRILHLEQSKDLISFEIIIQLAAVFAIIVYYKNRLQEVFVIWKQLFIAFLPVAIIGFLASDFIENLFSVKVVAYSFIVGGVIMIIVEKLHKTKNDKKINSLEKMTAKQALAVGIFQVFSLIPGTSRSGATIIGGMLSGLSRLKSTEFSFLLALPVMSAASVYGLYKNYNHIASNSDNFIYFITGFFLSFIFSYITIILFVKFIEKFNFIPFGVYRIFFGTLLLIAFL